MFDLETWEMASYIVTVIGLPFAIAIFVWENRRERLNEEAEIYQRLTDEYTGFVRLVLENPDLRLLRPPDLPVELTTEQAERRLALFSILVAIFERAYILVYEETMPARTRRLWQSWEDYMREWCRRPDFRAVLPDLLPGEDEDFAAHLTRLAREEAARPARFNPAASA